MDSEITVHFHAPLSDLVGSRQVTLPARQPLSVADLLRLLGARFPALVPFIAASEVSEEGVLVVIDDRAAAPGDPVRPGDQVSLFPQISGG